MNRTGYRLFQYPDVIRPLAFYSTRAITSVSVSFIIGKVDWQIKYRYLALIVYETTQFKDTQNFITVLKGKD